MFKCVGNLRYNDILQNPYEVKIDSLKKGVNLLEDYLIVKDSSIRVYNRKCDHLGGKIISNGDIHLCPIHKWIFNPLTGLYNNGLKKKESNYSIKNKKIIIENIKKIPQITSSKNDLSTKIRFFNHAFLQVESKNIKFATDPWAIGPAFNSGWWLKYPTKNDWEKELNSCDFIYVSHNHPDHLHPQTLNKIDKNIPIVVPNFISDSTGKYISSLGFKRIFRLEFNKEYKLSGTDLFLSILKSGDFREDSGIYFSIGNLTCLFDVDSNIINFNKLPNVDVYASSFGGGASGYPLMFENYTKQERKKILEKEKLIIKNFKYKTIKEIQPKYFIPYASYFEEKLIRDKEIKKMNKKNTVNDYKSLTKNMKINILEIPKYDLFEFKNHRLVSYTNIKSLPTKDLKPEKYLSYFKNNYALFDLEYIKYYFKNSKFCDQLILIINLVDDNFDSSFEKFLIDFSSSKIIFKKLNEVNFVKIKNKYKNKKILYLKCRKESFLHTVYNMNPWEDLLIGFQCKVKRFPNSYNINFWNHFTNIYIKSKNIRKINNCNSCEKINHYFDNEIHKENTKIA